MVALLEEIHAVAPRVTLIVAWSEKSLDGDAVKNLPSDTNTEPWV